MIIFIIIIIILNSDAVSSLPVIFTLSKWLIRKNIDQTKKDKLNIDQTFPFSQNCMLIMTYLVWAEVTYDKEE